MVSIEHKEGLLWTPVNVRARCEKVVHRYCESVGLLSYLPIYRKISRRQRRTVESLLPMFPGYLFVQMEWENREQLLLSTKISRFFRMDAASEALLISELRSVQILEQVPLDSDPVVAPELVAGKPVEITEGPFRGMMGIVEQRAKKTRISVNVDMLGQSVTVELDVGELVPVP